MTTSSHRREPTPSRMEPLGRSGGKVSSNNGHLWRTEDSAEDSCVTKGADVLSFDRHLVKEGGYLLS